MICECDMALYNKSMDNNEFGNHLYPYPLPIN